jgi:quercetin dioxygenase-like cupin family protein
MWSSDEAVLIGRLWVKQMVLASGAAAVQHRHAFDHATLLARGRVRVVTDGEQMEFSAPRIIVIERGRHHGFLALEDDTVLYCVHALHEGEAMPEVEAMEPKIAQTLGVD